MAPLRDVLATKEGHLLHFLQSYPCKKEEKEIHAAVWYIGTVLVRVRFGQDCRGYKASVRWTIKSSISKQIHFSVTNCYYFSILKVGNTDLYWHCKSHFYVPTYLLFKIGKKKKKKMEMVKG